MAHYNPHDFENLYHASFKQLSKYVFFKVAQISDAEDIVQSVYTKFYAYVLKKGPVVENLLAYLTQMANHELANYYKQKDQSPFLLEEEAWNAIPDPDTDLETELFNQFEVDEIKRLIKTLAQEDQSILVAKIRLELSFSQIATQLKIPESSVKSRYYRALKHLRSLLESQR